MPTCASWLVLSSAVAVSISPCPPLFLSFQLQETLQLTEELARRTEELSGLRNELTRAAAPR